MDTGINERIKQLIKDNYKSVNDFARQSGLSQKALSNMFLRGTDPSYRAICSIVETTNVDAGWLLTGEGTMIKSEHPPHGEVSPPAGSIEQEVAELRSYIMKKDSAYMEVMRQNVSLVKELVALRKEIVDDIERLLDRYGLTKMEDMHRELLSAIVRSREAAMPSKREGNERLPLAV